MILANIQINLWYLALIIINLTIITLGIAIIFAIINSIIEVYKKRKIKNKQLQKLDEQFSKMIKSLDKENVDKKENKD